MEKATEKNEKRVWHLLKKKFANVENHMKWYQFRSEENHILEFCRATHPHKSVHFPTNISFANNFQSFSEPNFPHFTNHSHLAWIILFPITQSLVLSITPDVLERNLIEKPWSHLLELRNRNWLPNTNVNRSLSSSTNTRIEDLQWRELHLTFQQNLPNHPKDKSSKIRRW